MPLSESDIHAKNILKVLMPFILIFTAWVASAVILYNGYLYGLADPVNFARSGALVVAVALLVASIDHMTVAKAISSSFSTLEDHIEERVFKQHIESKLEQYRLKKSSQEIAFLEDMFREQYFDLAPYRYGKVIQQKLQKHEVLLGAIGTIIWGFGDLAAIYWF